MLLIRLKASTETTAFLATQTIPPLKWNVFWPHLLRLSVAVKDHDDAAGPEE